MNGNVNANGRGLSPEFMEALLNGVLKPILDLVKADHTLDLQIRENMVLIYYRGGKLLQVNKEGNSYSLTCESNYLHHLNIPIADLLKLPEEMRELNYSVNVNSDLGTVENFVRILPRRKQIMDSYFSLVGRGNENEFRQLIVRENNRDATLAGRTDYFICDIQSNIGGRGFIDLVAVHWLSPHTEGREKRLALIELKYEDNAIAEGSPGIVDHARDVANFVANGNHTEFKEEMKAYFNQKRELGLIKCGWDIDKFKDCQLEFILILANHDPSGTILRRELEKLPAIFENVNVDLKIAASTLAGYGLFDEGIYGYKDFMDKFTSQI